MEEMLKIQKPSKAVSPDNDDVWELSRQGSVVPPESEPTLYYSRKHRLEHSSRAIRKLHDPDSGSRGGFNSHVFGGFSRVFSGFSSHPPKKIMFVPLIILCLFIAFLARFNGVTGTKYLGGNTITAKARRFDDMTFITINKTFKEEDVGIVYNGVVDVAVGPLPRPSPSIRRNPFAEKEVVVDEDHPVIIEQLEFTFEPREVYELVLPYEAPDFLLIMQISDEEPITIRLSANRPFRLFGIEL
ncbi:MAG: hypothetical protein LBJ41_05075 [Treponema sp.]|jgi:hypothetical protein|nr:hypothetical protein [Treponema sp.]